LHEITMSTSAPKKGSKEVVSKTQKKGDKKLEQEGKLLHLHMQGAEAGSTDTGTSTNTTGIMIAFVRDGFEHITKETSPLMLFNKCSTIASVGEPHNRASAAAAGVASQASHAQGHQGHHQAHQLQVTRSPWLVVLRTIRRNSINISGTNESLAMVQVCYQMRMVKLSIVMQKT
uniref:Uncharacterized protein n=1 Tax=Terrapene triunguis TaxID=2587831 RepID=A0A674JZN9_9SAUR